MSSEKINEQTDPSQQDGATVGASTRGMSAAEFGRRMAAAEEETERYADSEDTDGEGVGGKVSTYESETTNTPGPVGAFAGSSRHS